MTNFEIYTYLKAQKGMKTIDKIIDRNVTSISSDRVTSIGAYAFYNCGKLTTADFPSATNIETSAFYDCRNLTSVNIPNATKVGGRAFFHCARLTTVEFPNVTSLEDQAFSTCSSLTTAKFPSVTNVGYAAFSSCPQLTTLDCSNVTNVGSSAFVNCGKFNRFIIRTDSFVATLSNTNAFVGTPIASGTGYIYVPDDLVNSYKTATNWAVFEDQIKGISELEEET